MSDRYFLDTNILVYCFDRQQPRKREKALALVADALQNGNGMISWQVVQEFLNVATRKFAQPLTPADAAIYLQKVLYPLCKVYPALTVYQKALELQQRTSYSFYDALILAGAMQEACTILYSEDMQNGRQVDGLAIVNPFVE
jgi:predicted nucleic acid-binding protein